MSNFQHGHGKASEQSPTYRSWAAMKRRCDNEAHDAYKYYGALDIGYDPRWIDFVNFLADMGERPEGTTLDRKDGNKNYSKDNCRWATKREQCINSSSTKLTVEQVKELRSIREIQGLSFQKIANLFKVSKGTISHILTGRNWKDVK